MSIHFCHKKIFEKKSTHKALPCYTEKNYLPRLDGFSQIRSHICMSAIMQPVHRHDFHPRTLLENRFSIAQDTISPDSLSALCLCIYMPTHLQVAPPTVLSDGISSVTVESRMKSILSRLPVLEPFNLVVNNTYRIIKTKNNNYTIERGKGRKTREEKI